MTALLLGLCAFVIVAFPLVLFHYDLSSLLPMPRRHQEHIDAFLAYCLRPGNVSPKRMAKIYGVIGFLFAFLAMIAFLQFLCGHMWASHVMSICLGISFGAALHTFFFLSKAIEVGEYR
ncbi:hypothetical protein AB7849_09355 [Rhodanobacter sp. 115]|uniref:hypothetical protein n=1 Tax=Rhodanobacter sp. FW021-MT20 TaxID=1162282 RepID=UPI0034E3BCB0